MDACRAMARGVKSALPDAVLELMPISDGGDGLIDALLAARGGKLVSVPVIGPLGERRIAHFALLKDKTAVVEMARASGLALIPPGKHDVMRATSYGTGQLIDAALQKGARLILVGMGGSATNDGGAGMAQALGARLLDADGRELAQGAQSLLKLARIDQRAVSQRLKGVRVIAVSDVTNPLVGPKGSARIYGPQKGATAAQVRALEKALAHYSRILKRDLGVDVSRVPGAGAAGGLGAGLLAFLGAKIVPGAAFVLDFVGAAKKLKNSSAALTGEGRLDKTSFYGKAPVEFARLAKIAGVPTALVCGRVDAARAAGCVVSLADAGAKPDDAMRRAAFWVKKASALAIKQLLLAALVLGAVAAARAASSEDLATVDELYFHRNQGTNLVQSIAKCEAMLKGKPDDAPVLWRLGRSLMRQGEGLEGKKKRIPAFQHAEEIIKNSVAIDSHSADAHFWLGVTMGRRGQARGIMNSLFMIGDLKSEMKTTLELDPKYGGAHHVLAEFYSQLPGFAGGSRKKAREEYEQAAALTPTNAVVLESYAESLHSDGQDAQAKAVLDRLFSLKDPADPAEYPDNVADGKTLLAKLKP